MCGACLISASNVYTADSNPANHDNKVNCFWLDRTRFNCADYGHLAEGGTFNGTLRMCYNSPDSNQRCYANDTSAVPCSPSTPPPSLPPPSPSPSPPSPNPPKPSLPPPSPPPPVPLPTPLKSVVLTLMASGSVSDYSDTSDLRDSIAANAGVDAASVSIRVAAASVIITATIAVPASTTPTAVQATLSSTLGTAAAASAALGITVESDPSMTESPATTPAGGGDGNTEAALPEASGGGTPIAAIGGGAAVAILLMVGLVFLYLRKKRTASSQSSVALTAISLTTTNEKDLEGGGGAAATKGSTVTSKTTTYTVELTKTPMGLGLGLRENVVTNIKPDSQAARDGEIKVGDRVVTVNGEAPTAARSSSTILQATSAGTIVKLEFTSEPKAAVSAVTEMSQSSSVSADPSVSVSPSGRRTQTVPVAVLARDSQKMRRAAELLESWKLEPSELIHGNKVGAGGQADVYLGRWQVSSRTSALLRAGSDSRYMLVLLSFYTLDYLLPSPTIHPRGCLSRSRSSAAVTIVRRARRRCVPSPRPCAARCAPSRACATQTSSGSTERAWSSRRAS